MVVQHNMQALNANRMLGITTGQAGESTEKLSSGYKINRAADDAAGLAISEKMRKQIRGLTQASENAEDGVSCVQTAEGALAEVQDMLQRMNELCVQAANGTNSRTDREYIQDEIDQLVTEIDRIAQTTKFNETYLLKGDETKAKTNVYITNYSATFVSNIVSNAEGNARALKYKVNYTGDNNVIIVDSDILTSGSSEFKAGTVISKGDDITDYMVTATYTVSQVNTAPSTTAYLLDGATKPTAPLPEWYDKDGRLIENPLSLLTTDGASVTFKEGVVVYNSADETTRAEIDRKTIKDDFKKATEIWAEDGTKLSTLTGDALKNYLANFFDGQGNYKGGLYYGMKPLTSAEAAECFKLTFENAQNTSNADFNTASYVAFINVELDSNVVDGFSGRVQSESFGTATADLSTDGTSGVVKANRELFIYNTANDTVVRIEPGVEMTDYLNDDNTMKDEYRLIDYISSSRAESTSYHVKKQVTNGNDFVWSDSYIERTMGFQKLYDRTGQEVSGVKLNQYFDKNGNYTGGLYTTSQARAIDQVFDSDTSQQYLDLLASGYEPVMIDQYTSQVTQKVAAELDVNLHTGADSDWENKIELSIDTITAAGLGIDKIASWSIGIVDDTGNNATDAIDVVGDALQMVSKQRSILGAVQNRLEHTIKNLDNVVENTTEAESNIRDTDMAEEMVEYSNQNILMQAGQSMLAQANQSNQGVLSLLQ